MSAPRDSNWARLPEYETGTTVIGEVIVRHSCRPWLKKWLQDILDGSKFKNLLVNHEIV